MLGMDSKAMLKIVLISAGASLVIRYLIVNYPQQTAQYF